MRFFANILILLWRIWFYLLVLVPIIVLLPILIISILKDSWYPLFFRLARFWATLILYGMGFNPKIHAKTQYKKGHSYMFVANHQSMTDIMLMLYCVKNPFVFVGKKELAKIPLFGFFYKRTCILVDRSNIKSRQAVFKQAQARLSKGVSVCIFPEGGVPDDESIILDSFKDGAFRLAVSHRIPVAPMVLHDNKKRFSYTFFSGSPGIMRVTLLPIHDTAQIDSDGAKQLNSAVREDILNELKNPSL
ncbi:MAG: lysophospholipid acyltransferase family protein [Gilvibacter sp.]